jgi:hypothetical protein
MVSRCADGSVRRALPALERGADGAAAGQFEGDAQFVQAFGDIAHDGVGETGGAGMASISSRTFFR